MKDLFILAITSMLIQNVALVQFLGLTPLFGVTRKYKTAIGAGLIMMITMVIMSLLAWVFQTFILVPLELEYLEVFVLVVLIASLVRLVELIVKRKFPELGEELGVYLPLTTANSAVLGVALLTVRRQYDLVETLVFSMATAVGLLIAIFLITGVRKRLETANVPEALKGYPIALISAGLIAMSFLAFGGLGL